MEKYPEFISVEIKDIPSYNCEEDSYLSLSLKVVFEEETYRKLYNYHEDSFTFVRKLCDNFELNQFKK